MEVFIVLYHDFDDVSIKGVYSKKELAEKRIEELKEQRINEYRQWWDVDRIRYRRKLYNAGVPNYINIEAANKEQEKLLLDESLARLRAALDKNYSIDWMVMDG